MWPSVPAELVPCVYKPHIISLQSWNIDNLMYVYSPEFMLLILYIIQRIYFNIMVCCWVPRLGGDLFFK